MPSINAGCCPRVAIAPPPAAEQAPRIVVVVPARDEAGNICRCLNSLLAQDYPTSRFKVLVVDDHSTDDTAAIARRIAAGHPQLSLLASPPLPPRWTGKSHACWFGARAAGPGSDWLCFVDADVWGEPALLSSAMSAALAQRLDLLSLAPRQELRSFAERLVLPCGLILLSFTQDLRQVQAQSGSGVTATGQFMLIRRDAYDAMGGHAAVSTAICEDLEIARLFKQSGRSVLLMSGEEVVSTRMYTGWRTLWPGLAKNLVDTFGGSRATLLLALAAVILGWAAVLIPLIDASGLRGKHMGRVGRINGCAARFGRGVRIAYRGCVPFPYSFLVRAFVPAWLYDRRPHGARQRAPPPQRPSELERPDLFMNDANTSEDPHTAPQPSATRALDPGETRAVILAAAALAVFLYFIKLILLPFVLAAIVAYICTGPLDWIAKRTRWPRMLFAVFLFLLFLVFGGLFSVFAAKRVAIETRRPGERTSSKYWKISPARPSAIIPSNCSDAQ